jgi:pimeloyl-ACP methyl ester carboxylesterase
MSQSRLRRVLAALAFAGLAGALLPSAVAAPPGQAGHDATLGPLISGTGSYVDGTYVWTDYAYDDRGPGRSGQLGGSTAYPPDMSPNNVADLIQLQVAASRHDRLRFTAVLQTLTPSTRPLLGIGLDSDDDPATGAAALPGSWQPAAPLGMDRLFVLGVDGGRELAAQGDGWVEVGGFPVTVDTERNTLVAEVGVALPDRSLRAVGVVGYEHAGASWLTGDAPIHDLAFVDDGWVSRSYLEGVVVDASGFVTGDSAYWQDGLQASILAGDADPAPAIATIDVAAMREGRTLLAEPAAGGFQTFLYRSELRLGEGVQGSGNSAFYAGPFQPYLVRLPEDLRPGLPLVLYLHGASQTHISTINTAHHDPGAAVPVLPLPDALFELDAVVAWPLGRGPQQWYREASEQDALDVADDVLERLLLDHDRVMVAGMSMGGYGAFRLAQLYPDRWSLAYSDVGADQMDLLGNLTNVPLRFQNGVVDPLVNVLLARQARERADAAGTVDYRSWILDLDTHRPAAALSECVYREALETPRIVDPARVRYTVDPSLFVDDAASGLRLVYDRAYWVSGLEPAGAGRGSVDLETRALGWRSVAGATTLERYENVVSGRDLCGPNPDVRTLDTWEEQARHVERVSAPAEPVLTGEIHGFAALTIAADRAGLTAFDRSSLQLTIDGEATLRVTGLAPGTPVSMGDTTARAGGTGEAQVRLPAGDVVVTIGR